MKKILVIAGPSGVGKSTVCKHLLSVFDGKLSFSISATTRPMRGKEQNGVEYYFYSKNDFETMINNGEILEYNKVHTYYYGTPVIELERIWGENKIPIMDIDVKGILFMKERFEVFSVFIMPPSMEVLEERIRNRGENDEESIKIRLAEAVKEIERRHNCDLIVVNDNLETALETVEKAVGNFLAEE